MRYGAEHSDQGPGWLDICVYLAEIRKRTGRSYRITLGATGELSDTRSVLLGVQLYYAGTPVLGDDGPIVASYWPNPNARRVEYEVYKMLYRLDRALEERELSAEQQAFF